MPLSDEAFGNSSGVAATLVFTPVGATNTGTPSNASFGAFVLSPNSNGGRSTVEGFVSSAAVATIPVPGTALLTLSGLALFGLIRGKRRTT